MDSPCIVWPGNLHNKGYGRVRGTQELAHRAVFNYHMGWLPVEPHVIDHICRNRACVNIDHLQVVTRAENTRLGTTRNPAGEKCPKGHEEWYFSPHTGYRKCKACRREGERKRRSGQA